MTKRCVGNPPRQTEDPLAPPCVAHFDGDNGGATHRGVTHDEIRVLFYFNAGDGQTLGVADFSGETGYYDVNDPPEPDENDWLPPLRRYQAYFNHRFQTYGRTAHFYLVIASTDPGPESRRADALGAVEFADPFAIVSFAQNNAEAFADAAAEQGVAVIAGTLRGYGNGGMALPEDFFRKHAGLVWAYNPSIEQRARVVASAYCRQLIGHPVSFSGEAADIGAPRRLGLLSVASDDFPSYKQYAAEIKRLVEACGGGFVEERTYPTPGGGSDPAGADANMAVFLQAGVTTVVLGGGYHPTHSYAASRLDYHPEWMISGDDRTDMTLVAQLHDPEQWVNARAVSFWPLNPDPRTQHCYRASREVDPAAPHADVKNQDCTIYPEIRQLFTGIQVAGPMLTPETMERGWRAIPAGPSGDPRVPACFYPAGDYTCVKDAQTSWWDPEGVDPDTGSPGCYRLMRGGQRFLAGEWPESDIEAARDPDADRCNVNGANVV